MDNNKDRNSSGVFSVNSDEEGEPLKRTGSFEAMLKSINKEDNKDLKVPTHPANFEDTWDFSLLPKDPEDEGRGATTIRILDAEFQRQLEQYNGFDTCEHEVIKIPCPCPCREVFSICSKCHRVFCSNKCIKYTKEVQMGDGNFKRNGELEVITSSAGSTISSYGDQDSIPQFQSSNESHVDRKASRGRNTRQGQSGSSYGEPEEGNPFIPAMLHNGPPPTRDISRGEWFPHPMPPWPQRGIAPRPFPPFIRHPILGNGLLPAPRNNFPPFNSARRPLRGEFMHRPPFPRGGPVVRPHRSYYPPNWGPVNAHALRISPLPPPVGEGSSSTSSGNIFEERNPRKQTRQKNAQKNQVQSQSTSEGTASPAKDKNNGGNNKSPLSPDSWEDVTNVSSLEGEETTKPTNTSAVSAKLQDELKDCEGGTDQLHKFRGIGRGSQQSSPKGQISQTPLSSKSENNAPSRKRNISNLEELGAVTSHSNNDGPTANENSATKLSFPTVPPLLPVCQDALVHEGIPVEVSFSSGFDLFDFWVHDGYGFKASEEIANYLSQHWKTSLAMYTPVVQEFCIAKFSEDNRWYRCKVLDIDSNGDYVNVLFIDYGNREAVHKSQLRLLPEDLTKYRPSAVPVSLGDFSVSVDKKLLKPAFTKFICDKQFRVTSMKPFEQFSGRHEVKIEVVEKDQWFSLAAILENDGLGKIVEVDDLSDNKIPANQSARFDNAQREREVLISHVVDYNHFYVVPVENVKSRTALQNEINTSDLQPFETYPLPVSLSTSICLAPFEGTIMARAKIEQITADFGVKIFFIDFGSRREVSFEDLKCIPPTLLERSPLVYRCSLPVFPPGGYWDANDADTKILATTQKEKVMLLIYTYAWEAAVSAHIVEVFWVDRHVGLAKTLCKRNKGELCYDVDLDVRRKGVTMTSTPIVTQDNTEKERKRSDNEEVVKTVVDEPPTEAVSTTVKETEGPKKTVPQMTVLPMQAEKLQLPIPLINMKDFEFAILQIISYNKLVIKPLGTDFEMNLSDDIYYECLDSVQYCESPPPIGTVVIAEYKDGNWQRGVVKKLSNKNASVVFIDFEDKMTIAINKLKIASPAVLKHPQLTYKVQLSDVEDNPGLLLSRDFQEDAKKWKDDIYILDSISSGIEPYFVTMRSTQSSKEDTLSKRILDLQIWGWERLWKQGYSIDTDVIGAMARETNFETGLPVKIDSMMTALLPVGSTLEADIGLFSKEGDLVVYNVQHPMLTRDQMVLQNQISRYVDKIKGRPTFPMSDEIFLAFIPDVEALNAMNLYGSGRWNRCFRMNDTYYNLDYDEHYPMNFVSKLFTMRRIPPEFIRISPGRYECRLKDYTPSEEGYAKILEKLKPRQRVKFTVLSFDDVDFLHVISIEGFDGSSSSK